MSEAVKETKTRCSSILRADDASWSAGVRSPSGESTACWPPVVIEIGDVVALRDRVQWFSDNRVPMEVAQ
jgi:hypothetical protein